MVKYQDLLDAAKAQGIPLDWRYENYQPSRYGGGEGGNDPLENSVQKIAPELLYNDVGYSYDPDTKNFSASAGKYKDPEQGWGWGVDIYDPNGGVNRNFRREKTDLETAMPAILALGGVLGAGFLGAGGLGSLAAGEAATAGAAGIPSGALGGLGGFGEAAVGSGLGEITAGIGGASGLPSLSQLGSAASTASKLLGGSGSGSGNPLLGAGLGGLAGYLASRDQPKGTVDTGSIQMNIPQYEFSRNQQALPANFKPGVSPEFRHFDNKMVKKAAGGGITGLRSNEYKAGGQYLQGPGDGMSDNIRANIEGHQEARLADGEFVIPADVVSHIGNGSSNAGAKKLHTMMNRIRHARTGNPKQGKQIKAEKYLPA
jgi:hypothetical protein